MHSPTCIKTNIIILLTIQGSKLAAKAAIAPPSSILVATAFTLGTLFTRILPSALASPTIVKVLLLHAVCCAREVVEFKYSAHTPLSAGGDGCKERRTSSGR